MRKRKVKILTFSLYIAACIAIDTGFSHKTENKHVHKIRASHQSVAYTMSLESLSWKWAQYLPPLPKPTVPPVSPIMISKYEPIAPIHVSLLKLEPAWHHVRLLVTAYLIRHNQDDYTPHGYVNTCPVYDDRTASGEPVEPGSIAVDTSVFPFGTKMYVPGYGSGRASDRGGYIAGHHIDVAVTSCRVAHNWGARHVTVSYQEPEEQESGNSRADR